MTSDHHHDVEHQLRRAAEHLTRRGSEYRERPSADAVAVPGPPRRPRSADRRVGAVSALVVAASVAAIVVLSGEAPSQRLQPASSVTAVDGMATVVPGVDGTGTSADASGDGSSVDDVVTTAVGVGRGPADDVVMDRDPTDPTYTTPADPEGPVITDVEVPGVVTAGSSVTFRWRVTDADSVASTGIVVGWASGIYTPCGFGQSARLESGTVIDGTWVYSCVIPAEAVSSMYSVTVNAQDQLGHWSSVSGYDFEVAGGSSDASPPVLDAVEVVGGYGVIGQVLTVRWTLTDASGIDSAVMWVAGPTGGFTDLDTGLRYALYETMQVTRQCTVDSCEFTQTVQLSPSAPRGTYSLWLSATDTLGNKRFESVFDFSVTE